jgi:DNA-binding SARP family transcriptional activator
MGLTQQEFADWAEISVGTLRDLEQARTRRPLTKSITRLARVLGPGWLPAQERDLALPVLVGAQGAGADNGRRAGPAVQVLGPLTAWRNGTPLRLGGLKQRAVLGLLAVSPNIPVPRETLIDAIWSDDLPNTVVSILQQYISRLRHILDPGRHPRDQRGLLVSAGASYQLQASDDELDLLAFERLAGRARAASLAGDKGAACDLYERALRLWRAEPLADTGVLRDHPAVIAVKHAHTAVVTEFAQNGFDVGLSDRVLPHLRRLTTQDPLNERAHAQLMFALAHVGQQAAALREFEAIRCRLDTQLGVLPGAELAAMHMRLLRGEVPPAMPGGILTPATRDGYGSCPHGRPCCPRNGPCWLRSHVG